MTILYIKVYCYIPFLLYLYHHLHADELSMITGRLQLLMNAKDPMSVMSVVALLVLTLTLGMSVSARNMDINPSLITMTLVRVSIIISHTHTRTHVHTANA